jgi:hypothetical protein
MTGSIALPRVSLLACSGPHQPLKSGIAANRGGSTWVSSEGRRLCHQVGAETTTFEIGGSTRRPVGIGRTSHRAAFASASAHGVRAAVIRPSDRPRGGRTGAAAAGGGVAAKDRLTSGVPIPTVAATGRGMHMSLRLREETMVQDAAGLGLRRSAYLARKVNCSSWPSGSPSLPSSPRPRPPRRSRSSCSDSER